MFSGIITSTAVVTENTNGRLLISAPKLAQETKIGNSIAINGTCLTVVEISNGSVGFEYIPETISKTTIGGLKKDELVNIEQALGLQDRLDGHIVSGHVAQTAAVKNVSKDGNSHRITIVLPNNKLLNELDSITINGVSLTVASRTKTDFTVAIIPHTWKVTQLHTLNIGDKVNLEFMNTAYAGNIKEVASATLPTKFGDFNIHVFTEANGKEHSMLCMGEPKDDMLLRVHSMCLTGDTFSSLKCDCQDQLHASMQAIAEAGHGAIAYLNQEGRGIGLTAKIKAYALQDKGADTVEANQQLGLPVDARDFSVVVDMLKETGVKSVRLLTNNPDKVKQLEEHGLKITERVPLVMTNNPHNEGYISIKKLKLGHLFND